MLRGTARHRVTNLMTTRRKLNPHTCSEYRTERAHSNYGADEACKQLKRGIRIGS